MNLGPEFLVDLLDAFLSDDSWAGDSQFYAIIRPKIDQLVRVLRQCGLSVCSVQFFNCR